MKPPRLQAQSPPPGGLRAAEIEINGVLFLHWNFVRNVIHVQEQDERAWEQQQCKLSVRGCDRLEFVVEEQVIGSGNLWTAVGNLLTVLVEFCMFFDEMPD